MPFLEFVRNAIVESAANTYTEEEIQTPASRSESLAMLIWNIESELAAPDVEDGQSNTVSMGLYKSTQVGTPGMGDPDNLFRQANNVQAGVVEGSLSEYFRDKGEVHRFMQYDPPILYPHARIFHGILGSGNAAAKAGDIRVGYTLEKVDAGDFIAALVD